MEIKDREKILAIALGAALLILAGNYLVVTPLVHSYKERSQRIAQLTEQLRNGQALVDRGSSVIETWNKMQSNSLPATATEAESKLFNTFDGWVTDSGVTQGSFRPQFKDNSDEGYSTLECRADVSGDMQSILNFLYDLEQSPTAIRLESLELTSRDDNGRQLALALEMSGLMLPAQQP